MSKHKRHQTPGVAVRGQNYIAVSSLGVSCEGSGREDHCTGRVALLLVADASSRLLSSLANSGKLHLPLQRLDPLLRHNMCRAARTCY